MRTAEQILAEMPLERRQRIVTFAEIFKMTIAEAIREVEMAEWQNSQVAYNAKTA